MVATLWLAFTAQADPSGEASSPPPPPPPVIRAVPYSPPNPWERRDGRARRTFAAGLLTGAAGAALHVAGVATRNAELENGGVVVEWIGAPIAAGASLRSARAIREQGGTVSSLGGGFSWALWATGMILTSQARPDADDDGDWSTSTATLYVDPDRVWTEREVVAAAGLACTVASYVAAGLQAGANGRARGDLDSASTSSRSHLTFAPWIDSDAFGVAVVGHGGI